MKKRETLRGPGGLMIVLDATEIHPDDPGAGTPALVLLPFGRGSATFWCTLNEGDVDGHELTEAQMKWLDSCGVAVDDWVELRSNAMKRDGRESVLAALEGK